MSAAEFDEYAAGYVAGMEHPLKKLAGRSASEFVERKADWLLADVARRRPADARQKELRLLDFGCGTGVLLRILHQKRLSCELHGCDISQGMLAAATMGWDAGGAPAFALVKNDVLPYDDGAFDLAIISGVLHHIPLEQRTATLRELRRVIARDGRLYVFEHNPWNPLTRWVVSHTRIDRNAVLASCLEVRRKLTEAGFSRATTRHLLFFPVRWKRAWRAESCLSWLPIGGQYVVTAEKE